MSLMSSRQPKSYRWQKGDWIGAGEAAELLGYKSSMALRDADRRAALEIEFALHDCSLTTMKVGGQYRFLRSEIDDFITAKLEAARGKKQKYLRLAA